MPCLPPAYLEAKKSIKDAALQTTEGFFEGIKWSGRQVKRAFEPVGEELYLIASKTVSYVKNNWRHIVAYLLAWGVVVVSAGLMHGFKIVALPLTIGISAGLGFGLIVGILSVKVFIPYFDKTGENTQFHTLWNFLNWGITKFLDSIGTRQILLSLAVAVMVTTSAVFPYVMGGMFGIFMGNQIAYAAGMEKTHGPSPHHELSPIKQIREEVEGARRDQRQLDHLIDTLEARLVSLETHEAEKRKENSP